MNQTFVSPIITWIQCHVQVLKPLRINHATMQDQSAGRNSFGNEACDIDIHGHRVSELTLLLLYAREFELKIGDFGQICLQNHQNQGNLVF